MYVSIPRAKLDNLGQGIYIQQQQQQKKKLIQLAAERLSSTADSWSMERVLYIEYRLFATTSARRAPCLMIYYVDARAANVRKTLAHQWVCLLCILLINSSVLAFFFSSFCICFFVCALFYLLALLESLEWNRAPAKKHSPFLLFFFMAATVVTVQLTHINRGPTHSGAVVSANALHISICVVVTSDIYRLLQNCRERPEYERFVARLVICLTDLYVMRYGLGQRNL